MDQIRQICPRLDRPTDPARPGRPTRSDYSLAGSALSLTRARMDKIIRPGLTRPGPTGLAMSLRGHATGGRWSDAAAGGADCRPGIQPAAGAANGPLLPPVDQPVEAAARSEILG